MFYTPQVYPQFGIPVVDPRLAILNSFAQLPVTIPFGISPLSSILSPVNPLAASLQAAYGMTSTLPQLAATSIAQNPWHLSAQVPMASVGVTSPYLPVRITF